MMLSKHLTNVIQNLEKKKFREKYNLYKVEGDKLVQELLLSDMKIDSLIARPSWIESNQQHVKKCNTIEVNEIEMGRISNFKSLPEVIALAEIPVKTYNPDPLIRSSYRNKYQLPCLPQLRCKFRSICCQKILYLPEFLFPAITGLPQIYNQYCILNNG